LAQSGFALMGLIDTAVVGRAGEVPLAAVGLANAVFFAITIFGIGLLVGLDPLISQALGAGQPRRARQLYWQGVWIALAAAAVLSVPVLLVPLLLEPGGIAPEVAAETRAYLYWRLPSLGPVYLFIAARSYLQSSKRTAELVWATLIANVLNLGLDVWLVFGGEQLPAWTGPLRWVPPMGAAGAALATVVCSLVQMGLAFRAVRRIRVPGAAALSELRRWAPADGRAVWRIGAPVGAHYLAEVGVFALAGFLAGRMGAVSMASHQIAITVASLTFCFAMGIGNAGSVMVGWAVGARDTAGARRAGLLAFGSGAAFMGTNAVVLAVFSRQLASLMTDLPQVMEAAAALLVVAGAFQLSDGVQGVGAGVLRGAGDSRFTFVANIVGHYGVGLPIALVLGPWGGLGVRGIWWGLSAGLTAVAIALFTRFWRLSSREIVPVEEQRLEAAAAPRPPALEEQPAQ
jgi:MATE family multidrug resistance protein